MLSCVEMRDGPTQESYTVQVYLGSRSLSKRSPRALTAEMRPQAPPGLLCRSTGRPCIPAVSRKLGTLESHLAAWKGILLLFGST